MGMNNHNDERLAKRGILNAECRINAEIGMKPNMRGQDEGRDLLIKRNLSKLIGLNSRTADRGG